MPERASPPEERSPAVRAKPARSLDIRAWERGTPYGAARQVNVPAVIASGAIVSAFVAALLTLNVLPQERKVRRPTIVEMVTLDVPPPAVPEPQPMPDIPPPAETQPLAAAPVAAPAAAPALPIAAPSPLPVAAPIVATAAPVRVAAPVAAPVPAPAAPAPRKPVDDGNLGARMVSAPPPKYPLESRRKREQGTVVLSVLLGTDGRVESLSVASSSGFERLDKAALKAVREWRWAPLVRNGEPVQVRGTVPIPFILRG
ncbi:energy transducer TonB [Sphingomonas deserti]|uniref:Energy transducer TonB n=2 Tax=Allosphingosinicella deserti TaxID=2116704 RepID=A0A2P7QKK6_9SPHN|nr:energy transducer TonB [Sphingomonas deserti]